MAFFCVLTLFFIACFSKHAAMEKERVQTHIASFLHEFPVEEYVKFRSFIEQVLIPAYGKLPMKPLKRSLHQTTCTKHLFKLSESSKLFAKDFSDSSFSSIQTELLALHTNRCSNVIVQSMTAGLPKLTIALLMLAPFNAEYFESVRFGFKWNPEFVPDDLIKFLAVLRLSIIAPSLIRFSKFINGLTGREFDFNVLSLPAFDFRGKSLHSLVDSEASKSHAVVHLEHPRPVTDLTYSFEKSLQAAVTAQGSNLDLYTLKVDWSPGRFVLGIAQSMKFSKGGDWYHLRAALLSMKNETVLLLYDVKLRIWTLFKSNNKVQTVPSQFAVRMASQYGVELCYSSE